MLTLTAFALLLLLLLLLLGGAGSRHCSLATQLTSTLEPWRFK